MVSGGTEKYVIRVLGALPKEEFRTFVILDQKKGILLNELINNVDSVIEIKNKSGILNRLKYLLKLYRFLADRKIDIIQAHNDISVFFVLFSGILARVNTLIY